MKAPKGDGGQSLFSPVALIALLQPSIVPGSGPWKLDTVYQASFPPASSLLLSP